MANATTTDTTKTAETKPADKTAETEPADAVKPADASKTADTTKAADSTEKKGTLITGEPGAVPDKYELSLPKDSLLAEDALERIATVSRERGLSQEAASRLLQDESEAVKRFHESRQAAYIKERDGWADQVKAAYKDDVKFKEDVATVERFAKKWFDKELISFLNESGLGNHPKLFPSILKLARASAPDKLVTGSPSGSKSENPYASMFPASVGGQVAEVKG